MERIEEESRYDGFYAVVTNLEGDVDQILKINRRRWEIEENFLTCLYQPARVSSFGKRTQVSKMRF